MKHIALLGATGSIGRQTRQLAAANPELYKLVALAAKGNDPAGLLKAVQESGAKYVAIGDAARSLEISSSLPQGVKLLAGDKALEELCSLTEVDTVVCAVVGASGLAASMKTLELGKRLVAANKEPLVIAGDLLRASLLANPTAELIPADSEHVAIHQALRAGLPSEVHKIILTASGGPLWNSKQDFSSVTVEQALKHPTWKMGDKISIDSATMANKGLEVMEAHTLFGLDYNNIEVLVHPQSIIHGIVEFADGNSIAQLAINDMRISLQYALDYPERRTNDLCSKLNLVATNRLEFFQPDDARFPCLKLAYQAGRASNGYPTVFSAADEVAVSAFLQGKIGFADIPAIIASMLSRHGPCKLESVEEVLACDEWARSMALEIVSNLR